MGSEVGINPPRPGDPHKEEPPFLPLGPWDAGGIPKGSILVLPCRGHPLEFQSLWRRGRVMGPTAPGHKPCLKFGRVFPSGE